MMNRYFFEWNKEQETNIFEELQKLGSYEWLTAESVPIIEQSFELHSDCKIITSKVNHLSSIDVAKIVNNLYSKKWELFFTYLNSLEDISFQGSTITDNTTNHKGTDKTLTDTTNKESSFDSEEFVNKDNSNMNQDKNTTQESSFNSKITRNSVNALEKNLSIFDGLSFLSIVFKDIEQAILLQIY